jgi:hypothetical protein
MKIPGRAGAATGNYPLPPERRANHRRRAWARAETWFRVWAGGKPSPAAPENFPNGRMRSRSLPVG